MPRAVSRSPRSGAPHIVLLARHLPPTITGGVYRPLALMAEAERRGWRITALSGPGPGAPTAAGLELRNRFPASVRLVNWQWSSLDISHRVTPSLDGGFAHVQAIIDGALDAMPGESPHLIHATGPTFAEFIAAMVLARHWRIPYSLDYRDEWSESPFAFVHHGNSDRFWENRVLSRASLVTFTTEAQRDHQLKAFPILDRNITAVVGNGWDEEAAKGARHHEREGTSGRATVSYMGNLGLHCDLPEFLATLRGALDGRTDLKGRITIDFVGIKSDVEHRLLSSFGVPQVLRDLPQVPLTTAQAMMRS
ncbi:MAG TPA: glycosyltransferase, partial [Gemmatimonadales bacterium]|nr:glycosyltransferase [Gemmatimonadales bacterium]